MPAAKVAITLDQDLLIEVDRWVAAGDYPNRSRAVQEAIRSLRRQRGKRRRLLHELSQLDPDEERALADEAMTGDVPWPEY